MKFLNCTSYFERMVKDFEGRRKDGSFDRLRNFGSVYASCDCCESFCYLQRDNFRLGRINATILVIVHMGANEDQLTKHGRFDWESGDINRDRARWAKLQSAALPPLNSFSKVTHG